jgi:hypothetical protein
MEQIKSKRGRKPGSKNKTTKEAIKLKVDWEKLAKNLDKALKDEIAENNKHEQWCLEWRKKYDDLDARCEALEKDKINLNNVMFVKELKLRGIIDYLEDKIRGNNPV